MIQSLFPRPVTGNWSLRAINQMERLERLSILTKKLPNEVEDTGRLTALIIHGIS